MATGYQYTCSEDAFRIRSEDRDEVVESVQEHAQEKHDMDMSRQEILGGMEEQEVST
jgi:predicted small metal-binding protein